MFVVRCKSRNGPANMNLFIESESCVCVCVSSRSIGKTYMNKDGFIYYRHISFIRLPIRLIIYAIPKTCIPHKTIIVYGLKYAARLLYVLLEYFCNQNHFRHSPHRATKTPSGLWVSASQTPKSPNPTPKPA